MHKLVMTACSILLLTACSTPPAVSQPPSTDQKSADSSSPVSQDQEGGRQSEPDAEPARFYGPPADIKPSPVDETPSGNYIINPTNYTIVNQDLPEDKIVLLTFDDGPTGEATMDLLDVLDRHQAKSIWFVNGLQLATKKEDGSFTIKEEKAALLKEIHKRGHLIGNHTWWHENLRKLPPERQQEEILSTSAVIEQIIGEKPKYFRPPFGAYTDVSKTVCAQQGMQSMNWSVGSLDWDAAVYKHPGQITQQVLSNVHRGGNILFHDRTWTAQELDNVLSGLTKAGYRFVIPTDDKPS
ncbi:polysaccharide deacetylase family protein [Brevibacillus humidisoli]|uniref:polysaccharide deacetylase family protein n=1 Tax=Brevibacillus humidisoli TaxID=2895522 RepID=UPI001E2B312D|nr:polysaccharide deacetylase family protein [Brevibacillus humidisoli]UFJ42816.1 polysaccharide deacetylase family protein [Brevibacillus humidisoli]